MRHIAVIGMAFWLVGGITPLAQADESEVKRRLIEVVKVIEQAESPDPASPRAALYERAVAMIDQIVADYPDSEIVGRLIRGEPIGVVDRAAVERKWRVAQADECVGSWDRLCLVAVALNGSRLVDDAKKRSHALALIAQALAEEGETQRALSVIESISTSSHRAWAQAAVARVLSDRRMHSTARELFDDAFTTAMSVEPAAKRAHVLGKVASFQAEAGDTIGADASIDAAKAAINDITAPSDEILPRLALAEAQAKAGRGYEATGVLADVQKEVEATRELPDLVVALSAIARLQAELGLDSDAFSTIAHALRIAARIESPREREKIMIPIIAAESNIRELDATDQLFRFFPSNSLRALAFALAAVGSAKRCDPANSRQRIEWALDALQRTDDASATGVVLAHTVGGMSRIGCTSL